MMGVVDGLVESQQNSRLNMKGQHFIYINQPPTYTAQSVLYIYIILYKHIYQYHILHTTFVYVYVNSILREMDVKPFLI